VWLALHRLAVSSHCLRSLALPRPCERRNHAVRPARTLSAPVSMHPHHAPQPGDPPPPLTVGPTSATSGSRRGGRAAYGPARGHDAFAQQYSEPLYSASDLPVPLYNAADPFPSSTSGSTNSAQGVAAHHPPPFSTQLGTASDAIIYTPHVAHLPPSPPLAHISPADLASSTVFNPYAQPLAPPPPPPPHTHISPFDVMANASSSYVRADVPLGRQRRLDLATQPSDGSTLRPLPSTARRRPSHGDDLEVGGPVRGIGGRGGGRSQGHAHGSSAGGSGSATAAAAGSGGASRASVSALAAAVGARTTEKSCKNCRVRKVKCDRRWPRCNRCQDRDDECDFGAFVPGA